MRLLLLVCLIMLSSCSSATKRPCRFGEVSNDPRCQVWGAEVPKFEVRK